MSWYRPTFRSPLYPWVQIVGIIGGLALLAYMGILALIAVPLFAVCSLIWYWFYVRKRTQRSGVLQKLGKRQDFWMPQGFAVGLRAR